MQIHALGCRLLMLCLFPKSRKREQVAVLWHMHATVNADGTRDLQWSSACGIAWVHPWAAGTSRPCDRPSQACEQTNCYTLRAEEELQSCRVR